MLGVAWLLWGMHRIAWYAAGSLRTMIRMAAPHFTFFASSIGTSSITVKFELSSNNAFAVTLGLLDIAFRLQINELTISRFCPYSSRGITCWKLRRGVWNDSCRPIVLKQLVVMTARVSIFSKVISAFARPRNKTRIAEKGRFITMKALDGNREKRDGGWLSNITGIVDAIWSFHELTPESTKHPTSTRPSVLYYAHLSAAPKRMSKAMMITMPP